MKNQMNNILNIHLFGFTVFISFFLGTGILTGQTFTEDATASGNIIDLTSDAAAEWGDYDNDGDLDLVVSGSTAYSGGTRTTKIYRNDGSGVFTDINAGLPGMTGANLAWGDYDNDGDLDLFLGGLSDSGWYSNIFKNTSGSFSAINPGILGMGYGTASWGDYDNDGDLDIMVAGGLAARLYRNDNGSFTYITTDIPGISNGSGEWGDFDADGDLDFLISGETGTASITKIFVNDNGTFTDLNADLPGARSGEAAWADYDCDGDLDLAIAGDASKDGTGPHASIFRNDAGTFVDLNLGIPDQFMASVAWGDLNNDGYFDLVVQGSDYDTLLIYLKYGSTFNKLYNTIERHYMGDIALSDYDNDGDLDILTIGDLGSSASTSVYYNSGVTANSAPTISSFNYQNTSLDTAFLSWGVASDDNTPSAGLTYNVYISTTDPGTGDILSAMANHTTGYRRIAARGNAEGGHSATKTIWDLPDGTYFWAVQAIDNNYAGSSFSTVNSFTISTKTIVDDSLALVALYDNLDGDSWSQKANWKTSQPVSNWYGVTVTNNRVTELDLNNNNLSGAVPAGISGLTALKGLRLASNSISSLPEEIGALSELTFLYIQYNSLTALPNSIGDLTKLFALYVDYNSLESDDFSNIDNLTNLIYLKVSGNQLTYIPSEFGNLPILDSFHANDNSLTDAGVAELANMTSVRAFELNNNLLTQFPTAIFANSDLYRLDLQHNQINEVIPAELGNSLTKLLYLFLNDNQLYGDVPANIVNLTSLSRLEIHNNNLENLPDLGSLSNLGVLYIQNNRFTFEDIEPNYNAASSVIYDPQQKVGEPADTTVYRGTTFTLDATIGGSTNQYAWYKDFVALGITTPILTLNSVSASDDGTYECRITSENQQINLTIYTEPVTLTTLATPRELDSLAVVALYDSLDGPNWTNKENWLSAFPLDSWYGITVTDGRVVRVYMNYNNISGVLPAQIGDLTEVYEIRLEGNNLTGTLPASLSNLTKLRTIWISSNNLSGQFPPVVFDLPQLWTLNLSDNNLDGPIPTTVSNLVNLTHFYMDNNSFTGQLPNEIGGMSSLVFFQLANNNLSGTIPDVFDNMTDLAYFRVNGNQLSGTLPQSIVNRTSLQGIEIQNNDFDQLPDLSNLTALNDLNVWNNYFDFADLEPNKNVASTTFNYAPQKNIGAVRDTLLEVGGSLQLSFLLGGSANVYQWKKDDNILVGEIANTLIISPLDMADAGSYTLNIGTTVPELTSLILETNPVNLTVVTSLRETDSLALVALYNSTDGANWVDNTNWLTPNSVDTWNGITITNGRVTEIRLSANDLNGSIPADIANLTELTIFDLGGNNLPGSFPYALLNLTKINAIWLGNTGMTGGIPLEIANLTSLGQLYLDGNELSGSIPAEIGNLTNLWQLLLNFNNLTGNIPPELANMSSLEFLMLHENSLSGVVPTEFSGMANLNYLSVYGNQLTDLPDLSALAPMEELYINDNLFTFEDIEPNIGVASTFSYAPQDSIGSRVDTAMTAGNYFYYTLPVGGENNQYTWYKDDSPWGSGATLEFTSISDTDAGVYTLEVTNSVATDLTLYARPIRITVASGPMITGTSVSGVGVHTATFNVNVNPMGAETTVHFELSTDGSNWTRLESDPSHIINGTEVQVVSCNATDLLKDTDYQYRAIAENVFGNQTSNEIGFRTNNYLEEVTVNDNMGQFPTRNSPQDYASLDYRMFGLPGNSDLPFEDIMPGQFEDNWDAYYDNGQTSNYLVQYQGGEPFRFKTGRAFWVVSLTTIEINRALATAPINGEDMTVISLHPGWNIITNPYYPQDVSWTEVQSVNGMGDPLWHYEENWSQSSVMNPFVGYLFENSGNLTELKIPVPSSSTKTPLAIEVDWRVRMSISSNSFAESILSFGASPEAEIGRDKLEFKRPRVFADEKGAWFAKKEWDIDQPYFVNDYRPNSDELQKWDIDLNLPVNERVEIMLSGINDIPTELSVKLIDRTAKTAQDLRNNPVYTFSTPIAKRQLEILVGYADEVDSEIEVILPNRFVLEPNFPNPFNPSTVIPLEIAEMTHVELAIYDIMGRKIKTIQSGTLNQGRHLLTWDGKNISGARVASGVYLYRVKTGNGFQAVRKMILMK